jgi:hypothetical protein
MLDFHNPEHVLAPDRRIGRMIGIPKSISEIQAEINRCTPLCRRCHMAEDRRMIDLQQAHSEWQSQQPRGERQ